MNPEFVTSMMRFSAIPLLISITLLGAAARVEGGSVRARKEQECPTEEGGIWYSGSLEWEQEACERIQSFCEAGDEVFHPTDGDCGCGCTCPTGERIDYLEVYPLSCANVRFFCPVGQLFINECGCGCILPESPTSSPVPPPTRPPRCKFGGGQCLDGDECCSGACDFDGTCVPM